VSPFSLVRGFWAWYQRNYLAVLVLTTAIFLLQIFHLYWLFTDVVLQKLTGRSFYAFAEAGKIVSLFADYLEVPTLISASLLYVNELRKRFSWASLGYLLMLNTQWVHILWITDEVVVETFASAGLFQWNAAVAWVAILIDFLELPVILDTLRRVWVERHEILARLRRETRPAPREAPPMRASLAAGLGD
jgi:hypothetical protein